MKIYKVYMDLSLITSSLKRFDLKEYSSNFPTIFVDAEDPDGACHSAYYGLVEIVLKQDSTKETSKLMKELLLDIRILKVELPR
tara:strand:+ start:5427 stop:5678 length:252 start_codon:yes stop_codon:yes gene_type:complete